MASRIPFLLRCAPMQLITIFLFGVGGVLGMIAQDSKVLADYGTFELADPWIDCIILSFLAGVLFLVTSLIKPLPVRFIERVRSRPIAHLVAWSYVTVALALMFYNWVRLGAWDLAFSNPGAIAFRLADEKGIVLLYETMLSFFIGASYILDHAKSKFMRWILFGTTALFALGLLGLTRREMLLLLFLWGVVYLSTSGNRKHVWAISIFAVVGVIVASVALYVSLLFRGIDVLADPSSYFTSGEFEPFRYALYLTDRWIRDPVFLSPFAYAVPFASDGGPIASVNVHFNEEVVGVTSWQGYSTVTIFSTLLYFGFLVPLLFYIFAVFMVKQVGRWLEQSSGYFASFIYAFFLLKLFILIRNGEMFASVVDTIILLLLCAIFYSLVGTRFVVERPAKHIK